MNGYTNRRMNASALSATSRQPLSITRPWPRFGISTISVTPSFRFCFLYEAFVIANGAVLSFSVAGEDLTAGLAKWIRATISPHSGHGSHADPQPSDWWERLRNERRHAVAHAVREPERGVPDLDPDDPDVRTSFYNDARMLGRLVRLRVRQRWGDHAVYFRRRHDRHL